MAKKRDCNTCHHASYEDAHCVVCITMQNHPWWTPKTNADMIREKTDEELGAMLFAWQQKKVKRLDILKWLKEEAK